MKTCPICRRSWGDDFRVCPIDGLPLQDAGTEGGGDPFIGANLGTCRVVEKIADGDLGPVYKGEDPVRGSVAIQIISKDRVASPVLLEAFADAVGLAAQLNHPRVVRVFGMETAGDGTPFVSMEYVQGKTLSQHRHDNPGMSPAEACAMIRLAAEGIVAAHRLSMLHGALHPDRILVSQGGAVKVTGFHRSGLREGVDVFTATPSTLPYLAPEQIGVVRDVSVPDYRTDVYALAVILYEMLSSRLPFEARNPQDLAAIMEGAPPLPPNFTNPQVSPLLSRVVLRALAKHPSERHGSMEEFLRELDAAGQPAREPQRPAPRHEPQYPPAAQDSGLFPSSPPRQDSDLFAPVTPGGRKEPPESLWAAPEPEKPSGGETSVFNWFKTRIGPRSGSSRSEPGRRDQEDATFARRAPVRREDDEFEERTVVVSGRNRKRRSFRDTFYGRRSRNLEMTGTGTLPGRRFSSKFYLGLSLGAVLLIGVVFVLLYFSTASATGKLMIDSNPAGAQVYINDEYRGATPLPYSELAAGIYRVRIQMDGYETKVDTVEISAHADVQRSYVLAQQAPLELSPPVAALQPPPVETGAPAAPPARLPPFASMLNAALRARNFFPPAPDNALDILQRWQQTPGEADSPALEEARRSCCRELEAFGREKLNLKDFTGTRAILDQLRSHASLVSCAASLQAAYEKAVSSSLSDLRISARAAMDRQNYLTPESDNALRYVRLMLAIDPQDSEARALDTEIISRAWDQARARSTARQHQDALEIYQRIKEHYPNPVMGTTTLDQSIERERSKIELYKSLMVPFSVPVRHGHGRRWVLFGAGECTGILRIDGFGMKYQSTGEHSFQLAYDGLKSVNVDKDKITIQGVGVPDGRIELDAADSGAAQSFRDLAARIAEYRRLYSEYMK